MHSENKANTRLILRIIYDIRLQKITVNQLGLSMSGEAQGKSTQASERIFFCLKLIIRKLHPNTVKGLKSFRWGYVV